MNSGDIPAGDKTLLKMFVLDVLRYDIEQIPSILKLLNANGGIGWREFWPRDFTYNDILQVLPALIREKMILYYVFSEEENLLVPAGPHGYLPSNFEEQAENGWYLLTERGKKVCDEWEPPTKD